MNPNEVDEWCVNLIDTLQQIQHENNLISPSITNIPITPSISNIPINSLTSNIPTVDNTSSTNNSNINLSITNNTSTNDANSSNRERIRPSRRVRYLPVKQDWDYNNPCRYCGCLHLKTNRDYNFRKKCCNEGKYLTATAFPKLIPLPPILQHLIYNDLPHFSRHGITYNNMLALGKHMYYFCYYILLMYYLRYFRN
jgi:hypothetical protein